MQKKQKNPNLLNWKLGFYTVTAFILLLSFYTIWSKDLRVYQITLAAITYYAMLTMGLCLISKKYPQKYNEFYRPFVSIIIPAKNEEFVIAETIRSLFTLKYGKGKKPNYEVIVVDDNSSDNTFAILESLKVQFPTLIPVKRTGGNFGKSAVLNYGLQYAKGDIIAVFDADSRVEEDFLIKSVPFLFDEQVAGVQGRVRMVNADNNWLTKMQEDELAVFAHMYQISKPVYGGIMQLAGNGQLTKKSALLQAGGWNEISPTDDLDLSMKFLIKGKFVRYAPEAVVWQEAIVGGIPLLRQRIRWAEGMIRCIFDYIYPIFTSKKINRFQKFDTILGLLRILTPLLVWFRYFQLAFAGVFQTDFATYPFLEILSNVPLFVIIMGWGVLKYLDRKNIFQHILDLVRVPFYWFYNIFWMVAVPIGFIKCVKNRNTINWDKTEHIGQVTQKLKEEIYKKSLSDQNNRLKKLN